MPRNKKDIIMQEFTIDPYQSATFLAFAAPIGYTFIKLERRGKKAKVWYKKNK